MNLYKYMFAENTSGYGIQKIYSFPNGYGASVISNKYSHGGNEGLYEIAVIAKCGKGWGVVYDTPVTDDVIGWVPFDDIDKYLQQIYDLPNLI